ncbi:MAG: FAD-linked oxidase C-terminal domain-containing protein [Pseudomonadota bacterium]
MTLAQHTGEHLESLLGDRFTTSRGICAAHGTDISHFDPQPPDAVVFPETTAEVQAIVKACAATKTPIVPYGVGTSLEGHVHAMKNGVTIDLSRMDKILSVNQDDLDVVVQPGVRRVQLNQYLRDTGLFFPIDPGADATLGGMASTRASGTNAVRYGTMKDNVLSLEVVTAAGEIVRTARRARKSSAGYDLTRLFVGSEGTLGVITEVTVRLYGLPEKILSAVCSFDSFEGAIQSVIETIQVGVPMARIEFLDEEAIKAVNHTSKLGLPERPTLFLEFHGTEHSVEEQVELARDIMTDNGGQNFEWAKKPEERSALWAARHDAALSVPAYATGTRQWWTDVCVPISQLADCILATKEDIKETGLFAPILGHVGDGNFHLGICAKEGDEDEFKRADALNDRLVERALSMNGTCTGEHGIGRGKIHFLEKELGNAVPLMRSIKSALDPDNIMNPGKVLEV